MTRSIAAVALMLPAPQAPPSSGCTGPQPFIATAIEFGGDSLFRRCRQRLPLARQHCAQSIAGAPVDGFDIAVFVRRRWRLAPTRPCAASSQPSAARLLYRDRLTGRGAMRDGVGTAACGAACSCVLPDWRAARRRCRRSLRRVQSGRPVAQRADHSRCERRSMRPGEMPACRRSSAITPNIVIPGLDPGIPRWTAGSKPGHDE